MGQQLNNSLLEQGDEFGVTGSVGEIVADDVVDGRAPSQLLDDLVLLQVLAEQIG